MRSRKAGLPFATRARKRELLIREIRIENVSDRTFFRSFSENHFSPRFMLPCSLLAENIFFCFSKSAPTPRYTTLDSRLPLIMRSWKAGLPFATRARKRELSIREVRIENDSDRKYYKSTFFRTFSENHFSPRFMLPCSLLAENMFLVFQSLVKKFLILKCDEKICI